MLVGDVMLKPRTILGGDLATKARAAFNSSGASTLYVVDSRSMLEGVLDREDVLNLRSKRSNLTAKGIALPVPVSLSAGMYVLDAARLLVDAGVADAPVLDVEGRIIGGIDANSLLNGFLQKGYVPKAGKVSDFMTKKVVSASHDEPIGTIRPKLEKHRSLPVLKKKVLVGILTRMDAIRHSKFSRQNNAGVERIMKTPAVTVGVGDDTERAAGLLVKHNFNALPVVDGSGSLKGIITRYDLLKAYSKG